MENKLAFDVPTIQKLFSTAARIDLFKGKWQFIERKNSPYLRELRELATILSTGSSTRIEGVTLSNSEVETLLKNIKITQFRTRDEQEVAGYFETLELILGQHPHIELSISNIKTLHNSLMKFNEKDQRHKGDFKKFTNKVVATYPGGSQRVIFNTTDPYLVDKEMEELVEWTNRELENRDFHNLFVIGAFVYEFLSIHPFQDGNGRLSRLLTLLLLLRNGYEFVQYVSFEDIIEGKKTNYYRSLMAGQQHRNTEQEIIAEWMSFFLESLEELTQKLDDKYIRYLTVGGYVNERQRSLLQFIREKGVTRLPDIAQQFNEISSRTLQRDLSSLESERLVEKTGKGKSGAYRIAEQ